MSKRDVRTQSSYGNMMYRCYSQKSPKYKNYGGRGITVCDSWVENYDNFISDMGERPDGMTLDRIDVDGNYSPDNCRWATQAQQQNNRTNNNPMSMRNITKHQGGFRVEVMRMGKRIRVAFRTYREAIDFRNSLLKGEI